MGSKDTTKSVIHKPDTQKKPNLTPRKAKSSNWCPDLHHKGPKRAQSHPTEHQMGPKRLPRERPGHQESAKWPNWGFNGCHVAPKGAPERPKRHPKWVQAEKRDPIEKTMWNRIILMRKSCIWNQKPQKHYLFALPWMVIFGVFCENLKNISV